MLLRLIGKWLKAGVMEDGSISYPEAGSPQGGVISPILANVFLHYVLDEWFAEEVQPRMKRPGVSDPLCRRFVMGLPREDDARRVMDVLPKRFGKYGLTVHPEKTKLVTFRQPVARRPPARRSEGERPGTFDLLGFTHYWSRSRKGNWVVKRKTAASRFTRAVRTIAQWCRDNRHRPIAEQHADAEPETARPLRLLRDHGQQLALSRFREEVQRVWHKWLARRKARQPAAVGLVSPAPRAVPPALRHGHPFRMSSAKRMIT